MYFTCTIYDIVLPNKYLSIYLSNAYNILVYRQVQIIVAVTCVLYISYVIEYKE